MRYQTTLILIRDGSKILLGKHLRGLGRGKLNAPGGKRHGRETLRQCACRELYEETNLQVLPDQLGKRCYLRFLFDDPDNNHDCTVYEALTWTGKPRSSEELELNWYDAHDLPFDKMWSGDEHWFSMVIGDCEPFSLDLEYEDDVCKKVGEKQKLPTTITLLRHTHSENNELGVYDSQDVYGLTERGKKQADSLIDEPILSEVDIIYNSPFRRCRETLAPILQRQEFVSHNKLELREIGHGIQSGQPYGMEFRKTRLEDLDFHHEDGESFRNVLWRVQSFLEYAQRHHRGEHVLVCTHSAVIKAFLYIHEGQGKVSARVEKKIGVGQLIQINKDW